MNTLSRRRLLGSLGAGMVLPLFPALNAGAATAPRKRLVIYVHGQSMHRRLLAAGARRSETDFDFPSMLSPYEPIRRETLLLDNLYSKAADFPFGHGGNNTILTCAGKDARVPTFDHFMASKFAYGDALPVLNLGIYDSNRAVPNISVGPDGNRYPAEPNPTRALARVFGAGALPPDLRAEALARNARKKIVLDAVAAEARVVRGQLGGIDRSRLDQYLDSLSEVSRRADALETAPVPAASCSTAGLKSIPDPVKGIDPMFADRMRVNLDLAALALACGRSHVVSLMACPTTAEPGYGFLGVGKDYHRTCHMEEQNDPTGNDWCARVVRWHASNVVYLHQRLNTFPEAGGTVADNTVILHISDAGGYHHSGHRNWPAVIVGSLGGKMKTGRYLSYSSTSSTRPALNDLYITLATALGHPIQKYGNDANPSRGPLPTVLG